MVVLAFHAGLLKELLEHYLITLYDEVPVGLYWGLFVIFLLGGFVLICYYGFQRGWRIVSRLLLAEYVFILFSSLVFYRGSLAQFQYNLMPFWSYAAYCEEGKMYLIVGNILNVLIFLPIGLLIGMSFKRIKPKYMLLAGLIISSFIEILQIAFKKGFAEVDDVIHNTIGCVMGYGLYCGIVWLWEKCSVKKS